ncbi:MAG TPA: myxococcus cysteine-rich repeat containing protein [Candidatus Pacearchaeota archaeon]|nr:myxococcus cysteine-rich repeat containing protein [Candidatus Pacearchaeota archaeon]
MKKGVFIGLFLIVFFQSLQFLNADIISINSGGSQGLIINPDKYLEGFFFGDIQVLSVCGNGILEEPYEECDDGNNIDGDGCSATCKLEGSSGGGGGGGSSTEDRIPGKPYIRIDPDRIERGVLTNTNIEEKIKITNLDRFNPTNFSIRSEGFDSDLIVSFWDELNKKWTNSFYLSLSAEETYELRIRFTSPKEPGNYTGTIFIDGKNVSVILNFQKRPLLFDSNIIVSNRDYTVPQGEKLRTSVTLIPIGEKERMDVTLNYAIKDYENSVYLTRSETVLVENQINFKRNFDTGILPLGSYIVTLDLIYPNGVAPSSAHFQVVEGRQSTLFGRIVFFLVNSILIILVLIVITVVFRIIRRSQKKKELDEKEKSLKRFKELEEGGSLKESKLGGKESSKSKDKEKSSEPPKKDNLLEKNAKKDK